MLWILFSCQSRTYFTKLMVSTVQSKSVPTSCRWLSSCARFRVWTPRALWVLTWLTWIQHKIYLKSMIVDLALTTLNAVSYKDTLVHAIFFHHCYVLSSLRVIGSYEHFISEWSTLLEINWALQRFISKGRYCSVTLTQCKTIRKKCTVNRWTVWSNMYEYIGCQKLMCVACAHWFNKI